MSSEPKTFEAYRQLADDILTDKFCSEDTPLIYRKDILARILIDVYWEGWDERTRELAGRYRGE